MPRQAALALDRFDHRGFFAADIGAGAAAQMHAGVRGEAGRAHLGDLVGEHQPHLGIFVADIDVDVGGLDHPGGDQHAFDETVRIAFEIVAVLERAGLALVGVDRHQARRRLGAHQRPFAAGRKAGAAQAAQGGVAHRLDDVVARARAGDAGLEQRIAAVAHVAVEIRRRGVGMHMACRAPTAAATRLARRLHHLGVADGADRRAVAGAHAGRAHHAHVAAELVRQAAQEMLAARHGAGERIAHPHGDRRRRRLVLLHHVEMGVEGRDLVDFGLRELHLLRERGEMRGGQIAVLVLDQVQVLDQEIAPALAIAQQRAHLRERSRLDLAAFRRLAGAVAPSRTGALLVGARVHGLGILLKPRKTEVVDQKQAPNCHRSIEIFYRICDPGVLTRYGSSH